MAELPQLQDTQPVLNVQNVQSTATGYDAFAETLDKLSSQAEDQVQKINAQQSQSMYINSIANIEQLKTTSEMRLLEHPDQASRISDDMQSSIDQVKQAAFVNSEDRAKLNFYADRAGDEVDLKGTDASVKQAQLTAAFTHYANFPDQLKAYQDALSSGDEATATNIQTSMVSNLKNLVLTRSITPEQAGSSFKMMSTVADAAQDRMTLANVLNNGGSVTAKDYHTVNSSPLNQTPNGNANAPINGNTQWLANTYNNDKSFQGVEAAILSGNMPNMAAFTNLPKDQRDHAILTAQGVQIANGIINSGEPLPAIQKTYQQLSTPGTTLNYTQKATRNVLENYINNLKNGNYLAVIGKTPQGGAIMQNFIDKNAAIQNSPLDDNQKAQAMEQNRNDMVNAAVAYGHAHHIPDDLIKPIPATDLAQMQNGFTLNQNPAIVIQTLGQYNKVNQAYVANSLKDPTQRLIAQTLSNVGDGVKPSDQLDFIAANQTGRNFSDIKPDGSGVNDSKMRARIGTDLKDQLSFMGQQNNFMDGQTFQASMINSTLNYAKYLAAKNNDLTMSNWSKWVDQASAIYKNAYPIQSNTNYIVNPKQLAQPLTSSELDTLANYATNKGYDSLHQGVSDSVFQRMQSRNPLRMRISPTNNIEAVDQNGSVYFSQPYSTNLLSAAKADAAARETARKQDVAQAQEEQAKMLLHIGQ